MTHPASLAVAIAATAALLASGCTGSESDDPPRSSSESRATDTTTAETEEDVDIGGRSLFLRCWGERVPDEPTILLLAGSGPTTSSWEPLAVDLASERHHLCAYDRLGVGRSAAVLDALAPHRTKSTIWSRCSTRQTCRSRSSWSPTCWAPFRPGLVDREPERVAGVVLVDPWSPRVSAARRAAPTGAKR